MFLVYQMTKVSMWSSRICSQQTDIYNIILSTDRHRRSIQTGFASDVIEQMHMHYNPPLVLSFVTYPLSQFFQHHIHLTVLLSGLKERNSQLIPLIVCWGCEWTDRSSGFSPAGWFEMSDTS